MASTRRLSVTRGHITPRPCAAAIPDDAIRRIDEIFASYFAGQSAGHAHSITPAAGTTVAPGIAYGVVADGRLVHTAGLGVLRVGETNATPAADSVFRIASMTKSFVAAAVMLLRDDGVLRLDDPVQYWVPELAGMTLPTTDSRPPTVRQLLSMSGGFPEDDPWADRLESMSDEEYTKLAGQPKTLSRAPGIAWEYSNYGYTLLGRVIKNASGRPYADFISDRLLKPLGMHSTVWSDGEVPDAAKLAAGYALIDGAWVPQPVQQPGAFGALGGLYSTVADLAVWVSGFMNAWPARDGSDRHPLSRASRREMQQIHTTKPLAVTDGGNGVLQASAQGYGFGLTSEEGVGSAGRLIGHSGGYPGFGSRMLWHPECRVAVIGLANSRYGGPYAAVPAAVHAAVSAGTHRVLYVAAHPDVAGRIRPVIDAALAAGDFSPVVSLLAANVDMDEALPRRAKAIARLPALHGKLTPERGIRVASPTKLGWWLRGERGGRVGVDIMLTPEHPTKVQKLLITSVLPPSAALASALASSLASLEPGPQRSASHFSDDVLAEFGISAPCEGDGGVGSEELAPALVPVRSAGWIACDGARTGTVLVQGARTDARLIIDLGKSPAVRLVWAAGVGSHPA